MPEGHTLHRIARDHGKLLVGRSIAVSSPQGRFADDASRIDGATLDDLEAYGKHLFYHWSTGEIGHVHLGLFGKYRVTKGSVPEPKGALRMRLVTENDDGEPVTIDLRGPTACTVDPPDARGEIVGRLGPDPLRRDGKPEPFVKKVRRSKRGIGDLLMDQAVIAGIGNVYRAELLFVHGIHPERSGTSIDEAELFAMWDTIQDMLRKGVKANHIVTVDRSELSLARGARIPRREATYAYKRDECLRCDTSIRTIDIQNRTAYYCPSCQAR
ncbi:MAG: DNA-formamidopyrimidine glycosylase family protein [Actinomycetota bacterium]